MRQGPPRCREEKSHLQELEVELAIQLEIELGIRRRREEGRHVAILCCSSVRQAPPRCREEESRLQELEATSLAAVVARRGDVPGSCGGARSRVPGGELAAAQRRRPWRRAAASLRRRVPAAAAAGGGSWLRRSRVGHGSAQTSAHRLVAALAGYSRPPERRTSLGADGSASRRRWLAGGAQEAGWAGGVQAAAPFVLGGGWGK
jgi:hypothetical protein